MRPSGVDMTRLYAALSGTNKAIVRSSDRYQLFAEVCRLAVVQGGLDLAWVGELDAATGQVRPVARFGDGPPLELPEGEPFVCNDFADAPSVKPIRNDLHSAGFRSGAAFRLRCDGETTGYLTLLSGHPGFFDEPLVVLLDEMAADISFALDNFHREARRQAAEEALRKLSVAVEQSPAATVITDTKGRIEYVNPKFTEVAGYTLDEVKGKTPGIINSGLTQREVYDDLWRNIRAGKSWRGEMQNRRKNGELYWEDEIISPLKNERGEVVSFIAVKEDITERKRVQSELEKMNRMLRMISECNQALVMASSEGELLRAICHTIVSTGGYPYAWVGYAERDEAMRVVPMATAGCEGYDLRSVIADVSFGNSITARGAEGIAIRTGQFALIRDVVDNPRFAPWRETLAEHEMSSVISLPLKMRGYAFGVLTIYAKEKNAFSEEEVKLLREMGDDLAYGISSLRVAEDHRQAEEDVQNLLLEEENILENTTVGIAFVRRNIVQRCNRAFAAMFGYERDELAGMSTDKFEVATDGCEAIPAAGTTDGLMRRKDGTLFWATHNLGTIDKGDDRKDAIWVVQDIQARKQAEEAKHIRDRALESSINGVMISDATLPDNPVIYVNPAFARITGYGEGQALGRPASFLLGDDLEQLGIAEVRAALCEGRPAQVVLRSYRKDGSLFWNELSIAQVRDAAGRVTHVVSIVNDVTDRVRYENDLAHQSTHDSLTGLANRTLLMDRLEQAIAHAQRYEQSMAVLYIDLDHFKMVNDSLGHRAGDDLLRAVAQRFAQCVREADTVARAGSDEFVLVLSDARQEDEVPEMLQRIQDEMAAPFDLEGHEIYATCSIGASVFPKDGTDGATLLRNADAAMYDAKEHGRNQFRLYAVEMNAAVGARLKVVSGLRQALDRAEFRLHYQPVVNLRTGAIVGAEALVRWLHPDKGLIGPAEFIRAAEDTGLILPLGGWVLEAACAQNAAWQKEGLPPITMAVNLSARQFHQQNLSEVVQAALRRHGLDPRWLELELTESMLMKNVTTAIEMLRELNALGVRLSIDDFGTGYSSLAYLKRFPFDKLKIDQSFVRDLATDPDDAAIVMAVIAMAKSLNLKVIAEGVETTQQFGFLQLHQCDEIQGYYFSKPLPAEHFARLLRGGSDPPRR